MYLLLWLSPVQQKIKDIALQELTKITQSQLSIGSLKFRPFNSLQLEDVYAADLKGDTLLYAHNLKAGFNLFKLLNNQLLIKSVELNDFSIHVSKDSLDSPFNFQFLVDAFSSDTTTTPSDSSKMIIEIDNVLLKNGRLTYDILSEPHAEAGLFDFNHIFLRNVEADLELPSIDIKKLDATIDNLAFEEQSGFILSQLKGNVKSDNEVIKLNNLLLKLPRSEIEMKDATVDYTGMELSDLMKGASYSLELSSAGLYLEDVKYFYDKLEELPDKMTFTVKASGKLPQISIPQFQVDYSQHMELNANARMNDFNEWKTSPFELNLVNFHIDKEAIDQILLFTSEGPPQKLPVNLNTLTLDGQVKGSLPDMAVDLTAKSNSGNLTLDGKGGYLFDEGNAAFDLDLRSAGFNVNTLMGDTIYGRTSFRLLVKGSMAGSNRINARGTLDINEFNYNGYSYSDIKADASYIADSVSLNVISQDANLPVVIHANANLNKKIESAYLYANLDSVRLDSLNFLPPAYEGSSLSGIIEGNVKGFNPELMTASVNIDSLFFVTETGRFDDSPIVISYNALPENEKRIDISSRVLNVRSRGKFTYDGVLGSVKHAFPILFPNEKYISAPKSEQDENLNFFVAVHEANKVTQLLGIETQIPDSAFLVGKYNNLGSNVTLDAAFYCLFTEMDTIRLGVNLSNVQNNLAVLLEIENKSSRFNVNGSIDGEVEFIPGAKNTIPDMNITLKPTSLAINETDFKIHPAQIAITDKRYEINDFGLEHSPSEFLKINGVVSEADTDSVQVSINQFQISTVLAALRNNIPLTGVASGNITASRILTTPFIFTRGFAIDSIKFADNLIGKLNMQSGWSSTRHGLAFKITLDSPSAPQSVVSGFALPEKDSLSLTGNIQGLQLKWLDSFMSETLYGLGGEAGARIKAHGSMRAPIVSGTAYLNNATVGVKMLNTIYQVTDSISIEPNKVVFNNFTLFDEDKQTGKINGSIGYKQFTDFAPNLKLNLDNFKVLNNPEQTDSLFYGLLRLNGQLDLVTQNRDWLLSGNLTHGRNNRIMVNTPESDAEAQIYSNVTFINSEGQNLDSIAALKSGAAQTGFVLPLRMNISFAVDQDLSLGVVINPDTRDIAQVTGTGNIDFSYDMASSDMSLLGGYTINAGKATISFKNIVKRTFTVQEGGKLTFRGDPMATLFDVTAIYNIRTDMASLDEGFSKIMNNTRIPVNVLLTADGSLKEIKLEYDVSLPNQGEEAQRRLDNLLYTDDIKIREVAFLLATGSFMPINSSNMNHNSNLLTNIASSSISSQLNHLLSGVLSENWSIGTELHSNDGSFSDMDVDVNISTQLFNNRLTVKSTLGYNTANPNNNITGDFDLEYKLTPRGNILLNFFNRTNNDYFEKAKVIQGVGVIYRRDGRTFKQLFRSFRTKKKTE